MGRRILVQKRGKGAPQFRARKVGKIADAKYPTIRYGEKLEGKVIKLLHERGRTAPLAQVKLNDGRVFYMPAVEGMVANSKIEIGKGASPMAGNVLHLIDIPEGSSICNIELNYGDGGRLMRAAGASAILFAQKGERVVVRLPSGKTKIINGKCRATIGVIAGGGKDERPLLKAGNKWRIAKAKGRKYPRVRGVAMAAVFHPFGGSYKKKKLSSVSKDAPPGAKVGHIAPRQTGRKKQRKKWV
jgi:large subunit ribosomal protein L2